MLKKIASLWCLGKGYRSSTVAILVSKREKKVLIEHSIPKENLEGTLVF